MLVILDLDETLIHSTVEEPETGYDFKSSGFFVKTRPFAMKFCEKVSNHYPTAVWTSSTEDYAIPIVEHLGLASGIKFLWTRNRCTLTKDMETGKEFWLKNLKKVKKSGYSLERTIMIDDSPIALKKNYGNLLQVLPYMGINEDDELERLLPYLNWLSTQSNIRRINKGNWRFMNYSRESR